MNSKRKTPDLALSNALRYLQQIFKVPVENCRDFESAVDLLLERGNMPCGFDENLIFIPERFNVRGVIWDLSKKAQLAQTIAETIDSSGYLLLADANLVGKHSLMLCACGFASPYVAAEDVSYHVNQWACRAGKVPRIFTASVPWDEDDHLFICALQLSSYVNAPS